MLKRFTARMVQSLGTANRSWPNKDMVGRRSNRKIKLFTMNELLEIRSP